MSSKQPIFHIRQYFTTQVDTYSQFQTLRPRTITRFPRSQTISSFKRWSRADMFRRRFGDRSRLRYRFLNFWFGRINLEIVFRFDGGLQQFSFDLRNNTNARISLQFRRRKKIYRWVITFSSTSSGNTTIFPDGLSCFVSVNKDCDGVSLDFETAGNSSLWPGVVFYKKNSEFEYFDDLVRKNKRRFVTIMGTTVMPVVPLVLEV